MKFKAPGRKAAEALTVKDNSFLVRNGICFDNAAISSRSVYAIGTMQVNSKGEMYGKN